MSEPVHTLLLEHLKSQLQFAYFQMGLSASAIAFAVHETDGHSLRGTPWPIAVAVLAWALSFAFGCFGVEAHQRGMRTNARFLQIGSPTPRDLQDERLLAAYEEARKTTENDLTRPAVRFQLQLWLLFLGAMAYVAGHVLQMAAIPYVPISPKSVTALKPTPANTNFSRSRPAGRE